MSDRRPTSSAGSLPARLARYRSQALRLQESAHVAMQRGQWSHAEDLIWGSLVAAARGAALWYGEATGDNAGLKEFVKRIGEEEKDRYIRDAFDHLSALADAAERVRDRRSRVDYLILAMDDLDEGIDRLVARIPGGDDALPSADPDDEVADFGG
ncbi:MAG: hypothetical protein OXF79_03715 [Chloroflexi bacterium]|nr:hypothetical protein [Chloroflexota bacterium]